MNTVANFLTDSGEKIAIRRDPNGKVWNYYNIGTSPCEAGPFSELYLAYKALKKHRPTARLLYGQHTW